MQPEAAASEVYAIKGEKPAAGIRSGLHIKMSKSVSRVLYLTVIYLDALLPARSSHLLRTAGPAMCPSTVLLRIEFTAPPCYQGAG